MSLTKSDLERFEEAQRDGAAIDSLEAQVRAARAAQDVSAQLARDLADALSDIEECLRAKGVPLSARAHEAAMRAHNALVTKARWYECHGCGCCVPEGARCPRCEGSS